MKKITESQLKDKVNSLREYLKVYENQQTDEGWFDDAVSGVKKFFGGGTQPAAAPAAAAPAAAAPVAPPVKTPAPKPGEAPQAQAQAAAGPAGAPPKPAANAREQQYNTALKQIKDLYAKAGVQYPPQDDIVRQRYGLPPALPAIEQWDGKMPQSTGADFLTRNLFGRDGSKAVAGQQAANNISNTANAKSDAETEADVKELGTLVAQLKDMLAGNGPAPVSLSSTVQPVNNKSSSYTAESLSESMARLNYKIRLIETPMGQDPAQKAAAAAPPDLDTTNKNNIIKKIQDIMAKINGNNEDPPQDVAQALSDAQAAVDQFEAAAKNGAPGISLDNGVNAQGQNVTITNPDGSTTNSETGETTPAPNNASSSYTGAAPAKSTGPVTWKQIYDSNKDVIGANPNLIKPGQKLKMPDGSTYTVKPGDNLSKIAKNASGGQSASVTPAPNNASSSYTGAAPTLTTAQQGFKNNGMAGQEMRSPEEIAASAGLADAPATPDEGLDPSDPRHSGHAAWKAQQAAADGVNQGIQPGANARDDLLARQNASVAFGKGNPAPAPQRKYGGYGQAVTTESVGYNELQRIVSLVNHR